MWRKIEPKKYICGEKITNMRSGPKRYFVFVCLIRLSRKMATRKASRQICAPCEALANGSPRVKSLFGKYVRKSKRGI